MELKGDQRPPIVIYVPAPAVDEQLRPLDLEVDPFRGHHPLAELHRDAVGPADSQVYRRGQRASGRAAEPPGQRLWVRPGLEHIGPAEGEPTPQAQDPGR